MLRKLEKYEVLSEIGHGGMATVYKARDSRLDREVAIKILHPHLRGAEEARARFTREARSVARLTHPNILEIYDNADENSDESYIVTELLTGPTLKHYVEETGGMPAEVAACFCISIADALEAAHEAGIIHRDVKPENVLLHEQRMVKLTDFGIAQMVDATSYTATGQILGSPGHMAPEQVDGADCDARSDVFSLGTVLYYLATGELPFQGRTPHQILRRIIDTDYPDPLRVTPPMGERLAGIIRKCLQRRPEDRYQTARELSAALRANVAELGIDDPAAFVETYIHDRAAVTADITARVIARLPDLGKNALEEKNVQLALDYWNRVLAVDEKNAKVLAAIERLGRRRRVRSWVIAVGAGLGFVGLASLAYVFFAPGRPPVAANIDAKAANESFDMEHTSDRAIAPPRMSQPSAADAAKQKAADAARRAAEDARAKRLALLPATVVFDPTPPNVSISVDDGPPRPYGPDFRSVSLPAGNHAFRFIGGEGCCEDVRLFRSIRGGTEVELSPQLTFRPALLHVSANVPADVVVDDGLARGRTFSAMNVPMREQALEKHQIKVTAPGYQTYTTEVQLRAGKVYELKNVRLLPEVSP